MSEENAAPEVAETPIVETEAPVESEAIVKTSPETSEIASSLASEAAEDADLSPEEEAELEALVDEGLEDGDSAQEIAEMVETFKFKANGKDKEITLDWNDKEDIIRRLQLSEAAQPAMQKASEMEKLYETNQRRTKENPWEMLEELGLDPDELAEMRIQDRIEEMKKTPEQIAQEAMEQELAELREKFKLEKEEKEKSEYERLQVEQEKELEDQITQAIDATTQLSRSPYVVKRIADGMLHAMDNGFEDVTAQQIAPLVEKEIREEIQNMMDNMPSEYMEEFFGKKAMEKLRKQRLAKGKKIKQAKKIEETAKPAPKAEPRKRMTMKEFMKRK